jgi:hypothetical protein
LVLVLSGLSVFSGFSAAFPVPVGAGAEVEVEVEQTTSVGRPVASAPPQTCQG